MPGKPSPILGGFARQRSSDAADNIAINLGVEIVETKDAKVPGFLFLLAGLDLLYTIGQGPIRGMLELKDILYVVSGSEVYSLSANATKTLLGTVSGGTNPVSMFQNTKQLLILDGSGAWLVPGGFPLTGGTITGGGSLYQTGDKVVLQATDGGTQSAYPEIQITTIANNAATLVQLVNGGTTYTGASNVAVGAIQPQTGIGTGLTVDVTAVNGAITAIAVNAGGVNWSADDTGTVLGGSGFDGWFQVTSVSGGAVTALRMLNRGGGYGSGTGVVTTRGAGFPVNTGVGLTVDTTASGGPITGLSISDGGQGYQVSNVGTISGGTGDATYLVTAVGGSGGVTGFTILSGGAISSPATNFTQQSTDGSGQNLTLTSPSFGAFLSLVPITLPFDGPIAGAVVDGFGLAVFLGQQVIAQSNQLDLSTWPALSFGVADQSPDNIMSIAALHDEAYIFKERNTEVWANQGGSPFAFGPLQGVHIEFGTPAPFSPSKTENELIWLGRNDQGQGFFLSASAYAPKLVSTQALTYEVQKYADIGDAFAYSREDGGHTFYVVTFPSADVTWCYDKTASELVGAPIWTKMAALDNGELKRHWGNAFTTWAGSQAAVTTTTSYQAQSVTMTQLTSLQTAAGLNGLVTSFATAVFSVWVLLPDGELNSGIVFGNQAGGVEPGIQITVQDDGFGGPQISFSAWDAASAAIVVATYNFTGWTDWVNVLISVDTANQKIQVWANTLVSEVLVESELTPLSVVWSSSNPIGALGSTPWSLKVAG